MAGARIATKTLLLIALYRLIFVSNHLPLIIKRDEVQGWVFEWDEDALIAQAREGLPEEMDAIYVGCLPIEVDGAEQDVSSIQGFFFWVYRVREPIAFLICVGDHFTFFECLFYCACASCIWLFRL